MSADRPTPYVRFPTRTVRVGDVAVGGTNPIRIQTMTTSNTMDTAAVVDETVRLADAGAEFVRITTPGLHEAENLKEIRSELTRRGCSVPLVADIHFSPRTAMIALEYAEKVRINPGNFADRKKFALQEYSDAQYGEEVERARALFHPFVLRAKELGRSIRIGVNHGSLSDRIVNRYGDTPQGMVESAIEFIRFSEEVGFHDIIVSMKASIPEVMISAYRELVRRFIAESMDYPLHLGVTEAGEGRDGRIKSAVGIGSLLEDGIGDTIRVSLTEDSIYEIPVARELCRRYSLLGTAPRKLDFVSPPVEKWNRSPGPLPVESDRTGILVATSLSSLPDRAMLDDLHETGCDFFFARSSDPLPLDPRIVPEFDLADPADVERLLNGIASAQNPAAVSLLVAPSLPDDLASILARIDAAGVSLFITCRPDGDPETITRFLSILSSLSFARPPVVSLLVDYDEADPIGMTRLYRHLASHVASEFPVLLRNRFGSLEELLLYSSIHSGGLLLSGIGDAILFETDSGDDVRECLSIGLDLLQAIRIRMNRAEFISCPSCGRTLFDLQETTRRIREKTGHLKGVKIAIMGCIVNGPGEMADADFGYVGAGPGKIHLYKGKEVIQKNIDASVADELLIDLIRQSGRWYDP